MRVTVFGHRSKPEREFAIGQSMALETPVAKGKEWQGVSSKDGNKA